MLGPRKRYLVQEESYHFELPAAGGGGYENGFAGGIGDGHNRAMTKPFYQPYYRASHALVIGINKYAHVSPLAYAVNDATAVAAALESRAGFPKANIVLLTDEAATRSAILSAYLRLAEATGPDDRVFVFFAGHGHTMTGRRGETGFLIPADGDLRDLATLLKWSELTGSADLIPAKHVFFLMDACYGGLAVTRKSIPPGSMRLLNDMLQRPSRQVLTAGKADEVVFDGGGTRPGHSIFTAHVLDALDGAASATEGVITANGVMAYVYERVGADPLSNQTPHYGFLEGDGDFIFMPVLPSAKEEATDLPILIQTPSYSSPTVPPPDETVSEQLKRLIATPGETIRLDDFVTKLVRQSLQRVELDKFPVQGSFSPDEFARRVDAYEEVMADLEAAVILLARWATPQQVRLLQKILARLAEADKGRSGSAAWINLGWYPVHLLMYAGGISALSERRFDTLHACLLTAVRADRGASDGSQVPIVIPTGAALAELHDAFGSLPGMERRYTPRSDHLFQTLQPVLEDHLFLGKSYEPLFDEFEVMLGLTFADVRSDDGLGRLWGPPGRFGWKGSLRGPGPLDELVRTVEQENADWAPLKAGFFRGDPNRFSKVAAGYKELISQFGWY